MNDRIFEWDDENRIERYDAAHRATKEERTEYYGHGAQNNP